MKNLSFPSPFREERFLAALGMTDCGAFSSILLEGADVAST